MVSTYQVLAIRHRPKKLSDMVGQDYAVRSIQGFLKSGRIPQTMLVSGPTGSGKTTLARIISRYINCLNPTKVPGYVFGEPCGACWSCVELDKADPHHADVHEINAAEERGIDSVRNWIRQSKYKPQSNFRVFIVDEVHSITGEAASAFLKPLEEPSKSTIWILCTTEPNRLLGTARNRMVPIKVNDVSIEDCASLLETVSAKEGFNIPEGRKSLLKIAEAARGLPRQSLQILESFTNAISTLETGTVELDKLVTETAAEVIGDLPEVSVRKYLFGLYKGTYTMPLLVTQNVTNPQLFVDTLMRYHIQTTRYAVSKKLWDKYYLDYYKKLEEEKILCQFTIEKYRGGDEKYFELHPEILAAITEIFFEALTQIKQYAVDPSLVLFRMTTRAVDQVQNLSLKFSTVAQPASNGHSSIGAANGKDAAV